MKQSNQVFSVLFVLLITAALLLTACQKQKLHTETPKQQAEKAPTTAIAEETTVQETTTLPPMQTMQETAQTALFIGDSRAVGLSEYGQMENTDFFANVGMSVYNIYEKTISVSSVGKVTLDELLQHKKYDKIYIMLGINEVGYNQQKTVEKYQKLITSIAEKQPNAVFYLQANLHVTAARSQKDKVVHNEAIDALNAKIAALADDKSIYYMDANPLFDDANHALSKDKTGDSAHLYGKYYAQWGKWITEQSQKK